MISAFLTSFIAAFKAGWRKASQERKPLGEAIKEAAQEGREAAQGGSADWE
jgi:hypothetical protein